MKSKSVASTAIVAVVLSGWILPVSAAKADNQAPDTTFHSGRDRISYAFGVDMARELQRQKDGLNVDLLMRALSDALAGKKLLMTEQEASAAVKTFEEQQKQDFQHARMMVAQRNKREGEEFFSENAKKDGVVTLPSGLQYRILKKGSGKLPTLEDVVLCNYTGRLLDGTEIDSSYNRKEPTAVPVKGVIPGWTQALLLMPVGTKWEMYVPPQLAYGDQATARFGPNATLVFNVELLSIKDKARVSDATGSATHPTDHISPAPSPQVADIHK
jgi:FKBP-type peptidyl-prolyl cis-trans isomerase FklB